MDNITEFEVGGFQYKAQPMDAMSQFHVARRLAPVLFGIAKSLAAPTDGTVATDEDLLKTMLALRKMEPVLEAISRLSDDDSEYILSACLRLVHRIDGDKAVRILPTGKINRDTKLQYADIGLAQMMQIAVNVIGANLENFFNALSSS